MDVGNSRFVSTHSRLAEYHLVRITGDNLAQGSAISALDLGHVHLYSPNVQVRQVVPGGAPILGLGGKYSLSRQSWHGCL
jgi:hypothetical protein